VETKVDLNVRFELSSPSLLELAHESNGRKSNTK